MVFYRGKISKKIVAIASVLLLAILLCISPYAVSRVYAVTSSDTLTQAVLSKGSFGILKRVNNAYYAVDEHGNIIDGVVFPAGSNLDRYIGKQILVKDNIFAGLVEYQQRESSTFLSRLRDYFSGNAPKQKAVKPKPIDPIKEPRPIKDPIIQPMYGVIGIVPGPEPIKDPIVQPMYGVIGVLPEPEPIKDPIMQPMYGVVIVVPGPEPIKDPIVQPMYGVVINPNPKPILIDPIVQPMYGVVINPDPKPILIDPIIQPMYGVVIVVPGPEPIKDPIMQPMYGVYIPEPIFTPINKLTPIEPGSVIDKIVTIEKQVSDRKELDRQGIAIVPEMKNEPKPFQDGNVKK